MKYNYLTVDVLPEKLEEYLQSYGNKGYRFIQLVVMQKMKPALLGNQPQVITEFKLIFEMICQESAI